MREFAWAVGGTVPSMGFTGLGAPAGLHPWLHYQAAGAESPYKSIIAMPNFAVTFAIAPFGHAITDPDLGIDVPKLVHGEQEFEWFEVMRPGDVMSTTGVVTKIFEKANMDFLVVTSESKNQHGRLAVRAVWTAVIRR